MQSFFLLAAIYSIAETMAILAWRLRYPLVAFIILFVLYDKVSEQPIPSWLGGRDTAEVQSPR